MKCVLQALSSIDIGSLICNVGAGGGAPAGAAPTGAPAAAGDAPGTFLADLCFLVKDANGEPENLVTCLTFLLVLPYSQGRGEERGEEGRV